MRVPEAVNFDSGEPCIIQSLVLDSLHSRIGKLTRTPKDEPVFGKVYRGFVIVSEPIDNIKKIIIELNSPHTSFGLQLLEFACIFVPLPPDFCTTSLNVCKGE